MSTTTRAVIATAVGEAVVKEVPIPKISEGYLLVKTKAVALNPTDWKSLHTPSGDNIGRKLGCDYAGVVEEVGPGVTKPFKKGDRVAGIAFGAKDAEHGAFGEHILAKGDLLIKIPDNLSFEEAATLGVGVVTVGQGLYQFLQLPLPTEPLAQSKPILIYGGSTATGILGIQYAKLSGLEVLATASPKNFDYLKSLGADAVFDYHTPTEELAKQIRSHTNNKLTLVWDCSPTKESALLAALSLSDAEEGVYASLSPVPDEIFKETNPKVTKTGYTLGYTVFGESFTRGGLSWPAKPEDAVHAKSFWELSRDLLAQGKVKVVKTTVDRGGNGLEGVIKGLNDLKEGRVSATKLVYTI